MVCGGQGYDGASTMSGVKAGVQAKILEKQPKALYTHCAGYSINLAILNSCSVPSIRNCIDQIKGFTLWIKYSAKREGLLKAIIGKRSQVGLVTHTIVDLHSDGQPRQSLQARDGVVYLCPSLDQRIDVVMCECLVVLTVVDGVIEVMIKGRSHFTAMGFALVLAS